MPNLTGSSSIFNLINRDTFPIINTTGNGGINTNSSLNANDLNSAGDAIIKIETWSKSAFTINSGPSAAISPTVQVWLVTLSPTTSQYQVTLNLSPAFLEDSGAINTNIQNPNQSIISLAKTVASGIPRYKTGSQGTPQWASSMPSSHISVRLIGATAQQSISATPPQFVDTGSGISPVVITNIFFSHPNYYSTVLPSGQYEISLLTKGWVN